MTNFEPADSTLFFTRHDPADPRLGELAARSGFEDGVTVLGYPDDEGISLNGGRVGAAEGPDSIRRWLYRMTPHARKKLRAFRDLGNLKRGGSLATRHENAEKAVFESLGGARVLTLGGGNDYAYPDGIAFLKRFQTQRPLVINVDAHLDVRDLSRGPNSGTPFYRLLESGISFDFLEFGIQSQCNARAHWDFVESKGGRVITLEEILESGRPMVDFALEAGGDWFLQKRPTFLALDMDAFSWPYAVGTSAAWPVGLDPHAFWPLFHAWLGRLDVRVLGIYETSPPLDNGGTAKLAAQWAHGFLHDV